MAAGNDRNGSSNFNRALSLINEAVTMLRASPGNEETTSARESIPTTSFSNEGTTQSLPTSRPSTSRQVELVRLFPFMRPTAPSSGHITQPAARKEKSKPSLRYSPYQRYKPKVSWTHIFICLADSDQRSLPSREEKRVLKAAGLGEKKIVFPDKNGSFEHVKKTLEDYFEKLRDVDGVFEILRSGGGRRELELIPIPPLGYNVPFLRDAVGQAIGYIRPVQTNLSTTALPQVQIY